MSANNQTTPVLQNLKRKCNEFPSVDSEHVSKFRVKPLKPLFLFTRPSEDRSVEEVSAAEPTSLNDLPNEIFVSFRRFELIIFWRN